MNYLFHILIYFDIYLIVALSLNLVVGYCGFLTLAHAGYFAIGAYSYALLSLDLGWGFIPATITGAVFAGVLSLAVSLPAWRLRGDFFVLASLAIQAFIFGIVNNWVSLTNGPLGITGIPRLDLLGRETIPPVAIATITAGTCTLVFWRLKTSPWARLLLAMREDELAARGLGKNTRVAKVHAFGLSSSLVAIAGALYAGYVGYLDPSSGSLDESILMLSMVIVGGLGNFRGALVGTAVLIGLPEALRLLPLTDAQTGSFRLLIYGLLLILMMHFRPQGLAGEYRLQ